MISCLGTSMVTTRKSILTMRSTTGTRKMSPGPFAPCNLPSRKMTPRSYSRRMRMDSGSTTTASTIKTITQGPSFVTSFINSSIISPSLVFWFHFQRQSLNADDFDGLAGFDRRFAHGVPVFAFDKHLAATRVYARNRADRFAQHRFRAGLNRSKLRAQSRAHDENEKRRRQHRGRNDVSQGQSEAGVAAVEQHQRAEEKRNDAAPRHNAMRGREHVHDEQRHREANQSQPSRVHGQNRRHVKHEDQRNRAHDARQNRARIA